MLEKFFKSTLCFGGGACCVFSKMFILKVRSILKKTTYQAHGRAHCHPEDLQQGPGAIANHVLYIIIEAVCPCTITSGIIREKGKGESDIDSTVLKIILGSINYCAIMCYLSLFSVFSAM